MPTTARIATIKRIEEIYAKLKHEALVAEELDELVQLAGKLYESAIVLRYKAAEERIFEVKNDGIEESIAPVEATREDANYETAIDFSVFDETEDELEEVASEEIVAETTVVSEAPIQLDFDNETSEEEVIDEIESEAEEEAEAEEESQVTPREEQEAPKPQNNEWSSYFDKVLRDHSSGLQTPLSSLAGSFGLNERILYINTLFESEAEQFSETVQKLDSIPDWTTCVPVLAKLAEERSWDKEDDTTGEFILHVKRRYA